jgi:hypothetical protein
VGRKKGRGERGRGEEKEEAEGRKKKGMGERGRGEEKEEAEGRKGGSKRDIEIKAKKKM